MAASANNVSEGSERVCLLDRPFRLSFGWLLVGCIIVVQYGFFRQYALREITWAYPANFDQSTYLGLSYQIFDQILRHGIVPGLEYAASMTVPQGRMIQVQAPLLYLLIGPSRLSALTLNFLYFAVLECVLVYTVLWLGGRWSIALFGLGLLLSTGIVATVGTAGSLTDFRIDFIAFCLFGIFAFMVIRSGPFTNLGWSLAAGASAAYLILFRFLTATYIFPILLSLLSLVIIEYGWSKHDLTLRKTCLARIRGLLACVVATIGLTAPAIWVSRQATLGYYGSVVNTPAGKVRYEESGVSRWSDFLLYYPKSFFRDQLGGTCFVLATASLALLLLLFLRNRGKSDNVTSDIQRDLGTDFLVAGMCLVVPVVVLTAFPARSPVTAAVIVVPAIVLILLGVVAIARIIDQTMALMNTTLAILAIVSLSVGLYTQLSKSSQHGPFAGVATDVEKLAALNDYIGSQSVRFGWTAPKISVDRTLDYLHTGVLKSWFYERHGILLNPEPVIGGIQAVTENEAVSAVTQSDFVVLTEPTADSPGFQYPFNQAMKRCHPKMLAAAEHFLIPVRHIEVFSHRFTLYIRPSLRLSGESGDWITSDGFVLEGLGQWVRLRPKIELKGPATLFDRLGNRLAVRAQLYVTGQHPIEAPASITVSGGEYTLSIKLSPTEIPADTDVQVRVSFDRYFVPKELGLNSDTRRLVISVPDQIRLLPPD